MIVLSKGIRLAKTDDGATLVNRRGQIYQLNHSGAFILSALLDSGLLHATDALARHYGISAERALTDVTALAGQLRDRGLVTAR